MYRNYTLCVRQHTFCEITRCVWPYTVFDFLNFLLSDPRQILHCQAQSKFYTQCTVVCDRVLDFINFHCLQARDQAPTPPPHSLLARQVRNLIWPNRSSSPSSSEWSSYHHHWHHHHWHHHHHRHCGYHHHHHNHHKHTIIVYHQPDGHQCLSKFILYPVFHLHCISCQIALRTTDKTHRFW